MQACLMLRTPRGPRCARQARQRLANTGLSVKLFDRLKMASFGIIVFRDNEFDQTKMFQESSVFDC